MHLLGWMENVQPLWETFSGNSVLAFSGKPTTELPHSPEISLVGIYSSKQKTSTQTNTCTGTFTAALLK